MKYKASLKRRSVGGKDEYSWRRKGRRGLNGKAGVAKAGRYKVSTPVPRSQLLLHKRRKKY
jgi:hypothetical protein